MKKCFIYLIITIGATLPAFGGISYSCASNVDATQVGTCGYLNSVIAGLYGSAFTNANASIFIQMGTTGLGESTAGFSNLVPYNTYLTALTANSLASGNAVQISAVAALNANDTASYGTDNVEITSALAAALGITDSAITGLISHSGTTSDGAACTLGVNGCYNGIITITTPAQLAGIGQGLYWNQQAGTQPSNDYDFYSVVEHETDEVLGTSSCISTQGATLSEDCDFAGGPGNPAAVDLFRYNSAGHLALNSACIGVGTTPTAACPAGAYFSYNGGSTNGNPNGNVWNTISNGNDYADFIGGACPGTTFNVQDGTACPGTAPMINNDGGAEVNILNAIGFEVVNPSGVPEPATVGLIGAGLAILAVARKRRA